MEKLPLPELLDVESPAWPHVQEWIARATNGVEALPPKEPARSEALEATQVTVGSVLGAVIYETGGVFVDHGWLRILGSGHDRLPRTVPGWNLGRTIQKEGASPPFLLVADDIVGGFYAVDDGGLGGTPGHIHYFAPDTLRWESLQTGYSDFLHWALCGNLETFYASMRWPSWQEEAAAVRGDQALSIYPFPWTEEGKHLAKCSRRPVPVAELYGLNVIEFPSQLG